MTFRIEETRDGGRVTFRLIGRIRGENLRDVEQQIAGGGRSVVLDLGDLTLVDLGVVRFLSDAEGAGIELRNCPPFVRAWIDRERDGGR
jgi:anti-anti-sigma regulatory factor